MILKRTDVRGRNFALVVQNVLNYSKATTNGLFQQNNCKIIIIYFEKNCTPRLLAPARESNRGTDKKWNRYFRLNIIKYGKFFKINFGEIRQHRVCFEGCLIINDCGMNF